MPASKTAKRATAQKPATKKSGGKKPAAKKKGRAVAQNKGADPQQRMRAGNMQVSVPKRGEASLALRAFAQRQLHLELPRLGNMSPGLAWIWTKPKTIDDGDGGALTVVGTNMAGLWFAVADEGSIHLVDDCEREL